VPSAEPAGPEPTGTDDLPLFRPTGQTLIHQGWVVALYRGEFVVPSGAPFQRDIVRHPGAVAVVAVTAQESVVLVHQYRPSVDRWLLEVPAGICDVDGEELVATARRELAEEAGYAASDLTLLTHCLVTPGFCDEVSSVYLATGLRPVPLDRQGIEEGSMRVVEVPLSNFDAMVDDGSIVDATTILGVGLGRRRMGAGR
jgi:ADP-ribose pyrophosphatase